MDNLLLRMAMAGIVAAAGLAVPGAASTASASSAPSVLNHAPAQIAQVGEDDQESGILFVCSTVNGQRAPSGPTSDVTDCPALDIETQALRAPSVDNDTVVLGVLGANQDTWIRVGYPGGGQILAMTLQLPPEVVVGTLDNLSDPFDVRINVSTRKDETLGDPNADWPNMSRLGELTRSSNTGTDRKFWLNSTGDPQTYFVRLINQGPEPVPFALSIDLRDLTGTDTTQINPASLDGYLAVARSLAIQGPRVTPPSSPQPSDDSDNGSSADDDGGANGDD